jgi:hypothetical protein
MVLVLTLLAFAVALAVKTKSVGLETYALIFVFAALVSTTFMLLYFRLFI